MVKLLAKLAISLAYAMPYYNTKACQTSNVNLLCNFYHFKSKSKYKIHIHIGSKKATYIHELVLFVQVQFKSAYYLDCHKNMT